MQTAREQLRTPGGWLDLGLLLGFVAVMSIVGATKNLLPRSRLRQQIDDRDYAIMRLGRQLAEAEDTIAEFEVSRRADKLVQPITLVMEALERCSTKQEALGVIRGAQARVETLWED